MKSDSLIPVKPNIDEKFVQTSKPTFNGLKKISSLAANHPVKQYILSRQIPPESHFRIYYAPKFKKWINSILPTKFSDDAKDEPRLIFPLLDKNKRMFGISARGFDPKGLRYITIMFEDRPKLFGLDQVDFTKDFSIVEGAIDSLFLKNCIAMVGADANLEGIEQIENATYIFDNEPRNTQIHKRMEKIIRNGHKLCIWPSNIHQKDINDMVKSGLQPQKIISENTYSGIEAMLQLTKWRKT
jgi:hypothetical protein